MNPSKRDSPVKHRIQFTYFWASPKGRTAIVLDDMISTGGTMVRAAAACRARGAVEVLVVATHGLFVDGGKAVLSAEALDEIWVTDSLPLPVPLVDAVARERVRLVPIGALIGGGLLSAVTRADRSMNCWSTSRTLRTGSDQIVTHPHAAKYLGIRGFEDIGLGCDTTLKNNLLTRASSYVLDMFLTRNGERRCLLPSNLSDFARKWPPHSL